MPINQNNQGTLPKPSTSDKPEVTPSSAVLSTEQKPSDAKAGVPGRIEPKQDDAKRNDGRPQKSVNASDGKQPVATTEPEKDTRPVAAK